MEIAAWIAFGLGFAVVVASLAALVARRARERLLVALGALLTLGAVCFGALAGVNAVERFADGGPLVLATAGLAAAAIGEAGLWAVARSFRLLRDEERLVQAGEQHVEAVLAAHANERARDLEQTLARERANATHLLGQQERKLTQERRDLIARQADRARAELAHSIEQVQERLEQRLTAWAADLDRGQRALEARLNDLAQRQGEAIRAYEARLAADSEHLRGVTDEQQEALARLRGELRQVGREILDEGRSEIENHAADRRRALDDLASRFRDAERDLREHLEREQEEAATRITASFADAERRQRENLERTLDRAAGRLAEEAERRFDAQIKQSREKSAQRLSNELEKAMEQYARRAEKEISDRINEAAHATAARLERRIGEITRAAEVQHEVAADRLRIVGDRLDRALGEAEERIAAFETQVETQVTERLQALERSIRAADLQ